MTGIFLVVFNLVCGALMLWVWHDSVMVCIAATNFFIAGLCACAATR